MNTEDRRQFALERELAKRPLADRLAYYAESVTGLPQPIRDDLAKAAVELNRRRPK